MKNQPSFPHVFSGNLHNGCPIKAFGHDDLNVLGIFPTCVTSVINADLQQVWDALINPDKIKVYLFGTETESEWKVGSPIFFRGKWERTTYEDKGTILEIQPEKILKYSYWSSMSGKADIPENYVNVTFQLTPQGNATMLVLIQDGITDEKAKQHTEQNWGMVLDGLKKLAEL